MTGRYCQAQSKSRPCSPIRRRCLMTRFHRLRYVPKAYSLRNEPPISKEDEDFVARYFGEGIRPIVWFDAPTAADRLWGIIAGLWPALRRSFAGCTLCLQPRTLGKRMFDVMFAPRITSSRFSRLSADHFVGSPEVFKEPWHHEFAVQLFGRLPANPENTLFGAALDDDPTSIRNYSCFRTCGVAARKSPPLPLVRSICWTASNHLKRRLDCKESH